MSIKSLAIIGAGTMGGGIAIGSITAGIATTVIDINAGSLDGCRQRIAAFLDRRREKGQISAEHVTNAMELLDTSAELKRVAQADLVIEAVFEDLGVKQKVFREISPLTRPDAIIATNTSCLRVTDLALSVDGPQRFLGLHYFSPAEVNPLVEVVSGPKTEPASIAAVLSFLDATAKTALCCRDSNGFAVNRFFCPYSNEAARCLDDGLGTPAQIDAVARQVFGLSLGPFAVMNIIKPRINLHAVRNLASHGPFYAPAASLTQLGEAGANWEISANDVDLPDDKAEAIRQRLMGALFLPVLEALAEDVATPDDFDLGARLALRFGNPPVALMRGLGAQKVRQAVAAAATPYGVACPDSLDKLLA